MRLRIWPYKMGSQGAKELARSLGVLRLPNLGSRFRPRRGDVVVNWGNKVQHPNFRGDTPICTVLNAPHRVAIAANKIAAFDAMARNNVTIPTYTTDINVAKAWFDQPNVFVYCRRTVTGYGGAGIVVAKSASELVYAPLYTKGIVCRREYRVHVVCGQAADITRKAKRFGSEEGSTQTCDELVRNHDANWVYQRNGFEVPDGLVDLALKAVQAVGLDIGAVDLVVEKNTGIAYVLEINTAPGLQGSTVEIYKNAILNFINGGR